MSGAILRRRDRTARSLRVVHYSSAVNIETTAKYAHLVRDAEKAAAARTGDSIGAQLMPAGAKAA